MAKELSDSTPGERHLHLRRLRRAVEDVKKQMMWVLEKDFDTCLRCCHTTARTQSPREVSVGMHLGLQRAQSASK